MRSPILFGIGSFALTDCGGGGNGSAPSAPTPPPATYSVGGYVAGIYAYTLDANSGALTLVSGSPFAATTTYPVAVMAIAN